MNKLNLLTLLMFILCLVPQSGMSISSEELASKIEGCYDVEHIEVIETEFPGHGPVEDLLESTKLCVEYTPFSRMGPFSFSLKNSDNEVLKNWGLELSDENARCPCYILTGYYGRLNWDYSNLVSNRDDNTINIKTYLRQLRTEYSIIVVPESNIDNSDQPNVNEKIHSNCKGTTTSRTLISEGPFGGQVIGFPSAGTEIITTGKLEDIPERNVTMVEVTLLEDGEKIAGWLKVVHTNLRAKCYKN